MSLFFTEIALLMPASSLVYAPALPSGAPSQQNTMLLYLHVKLALYMIHDFGSTLEPR